MTQVLRPDICVIGAGSAGLTVAAAAASFGAEVVLVERGRMGGDCLNTGCVPSKALIACARAAHAIEAARGFGVDAGSTRLDWTKVAAHVQGAIRAIAPHDSQERFERLGVKVLRESARFVSPEVVEAGAYRIRARRFVVATGSEPALPPIPGLADVPFLTNGSVFDLTALPRRLLVVGGGAIGLELAQAFVRLGSAVTVVEAARALASADPELAGIAVGALRREGVDLREGTTVLRLDRRGAEVVAVVRSAEGETELTASHVLVAAGRRPVVDGLGLKAAGIVHSPKGIEVDRGLCTTNRRVYAIGDVAGGPQFTHVAGWHGGLAVRSILFRLPVSTASAAIPSAIYTDPEVAQVGLDETAARARHGDGIVVTRVPLAENDRAVTDGVKEGLLKVVTDRRGRILGAGIAGPHAGELIALWSLAMANGLSLRAMTATIFPYPTLAETARKAAVGFYGPRLTTALVRRVVGLLRRFG